MTARSTGDTRKLDPTAIIVFHQAYVSIALRRLPSEEHENIVMLANTYVMKKHYFDINIFTATQCSSKDMSPVKSRLADPCDVIMYYRIHCTPSYPMVIKLGG